MRLSVLILAAAAAASVACTPDPTGPSNTAPFSQTDIRAGTGATAIPGKALSVNYVGWLYDPTGPDGKGAQIDANTAFAFALGGGSVIKGWDQGIAGMQEGGIRRLVIPPSLGYGGERRDAVPPYATLVFEIELLTVSP
jgi:FKBP-type peptidyl-prolyl cis-trans isomerase FkpA